MTSVSLKSGLKVATRNNCEAGSNNSFYLGTRGNGESSRLASDQHTVNAVNGSLACFNPIGLHQHAGNGTANLIDIADVKKIAQKSLDFNVIVSAELVIVTCV